MLENLSPFFKTSSQGMTSKNEGGEEEDDPKYLTMRLLRFQAMKVSWPS